MLHDEMLKAAKALVPVRGKPSQAKLRRATSTIYYAIFHAIAQNSADMLVGISKTARSERAWLQVYRALEHGFAKSQCANPKIMSLFPQEVQDFATKFVALQSKRHDADYNPAASFKKSEVMREIDETELVLKAFSNSASKDKRAFAVYVMMKTRP